MGNCVLRGLAEADGVTIKVITCGGGVMELHPPVNAESVTNGFPGHGIFHSRELFSQPLLHNEDLLAGELYYLRPLNDRHTRLLPSAAAPYRVSFGSLRLWKRQDMEVSPGCTRAGVWTVKLVISPAQLAEILSQESRTEALVESLRTVAKCGSGAASVASSDQWSHTSSRKAASENMGL